MRLLVIYKIETKNYFEAYEWFSTLPFYSLKSFLKKDDLLIKQENINHIEVIESEKKKSYFIDYKDNYYFGKIECRHLDLENFKNIEVKYTKPDNKEHFKKIFFDFKYWLISPLNYLGLYSAIVGFSLIGFRHSLFPGILNPKIFTNAACNEKCISMSSLGMFALLFLFLMTYGSVFLGIIILYFSKYYSSLNHYKKSIQYLMIFFIIQAIILYKATSPLFDPQVFAGVKKIYQVRFDREYIKTHPRREIATKKP